MPLYIEYISSEVHNSWTYERERFVFLQNLQKRGLIIIKNRSFLFLTELGRQARAET